MVFAQRVESNDLPNFRALGMKIMHFQVNMMQAIHESNQANGILQTNKYYTK